MRSGFVLITKKPYSDWISFTQGGWGDIIIAEVSLRFDLQPNPCVNNLFRSVCMCLERYSVFLFYLL